MHFLKKKGTESVFLEVRSALHHITSKLCDVLRPKKKKKRSCAVKRWVISRFSGCVSVQSSPLCTSPCTWSACALACPGSYPSYLFLFFIRLFTGAAES